MRRIRDRAWIVAAVAPTVIVTFGVPMWYHLFRPGVVEDARWVVGACLVSVCSIVALRMFPVEQPFPGRRLHGPDDTLWTTRTMTGTRTIDLSRLRSIQWSRHATGRMDLWRSTPVPTYLVLTDTHGGRLAVRADDPKVLKIVRRALAARPGQVRISPAAGKSLGVDPTGGYQWWRLTDRTATVPFWLPVSVLVVAVVLAAVLT
jgi:hypothetical protein